MSVILSDVAVVVAAAAATATNNSAGRTNCQLVVFSTNL